MCGNVLHGCCSLLHVATHVLLLWAVIIHLHIVWRVFLPLIKAHPVYSIHPTSGTHPYLASRLKKEYVNSLLPMLDVVVGYRVNFTFYLKTPVIRACAHCVHAFHIGALEDELRRSENSSPTSSFLLLMMFCVVM